MHMWGCAAVAALSLEDGNSQIVEHLFIFGQQSLTVVHYNLV